MPEVRPVLAILWTGHGETAEDRLRALRAHHPAAPLVLLTRPEMACRFAGLADEIWTEAGARGPSRFLALVRRMSWAHIGHVYDFEASLPTRLIRLCVWPRPQWHDWNASGTGGRRPGPVS